jgi:hypothetical protein
MVEDVVHEIKDDPKEAEKVAKENDKADAKRQTKSPAAKHKEVEKFGPPMKLKKDYRPYGKFYLETDDSMHENTDAFESNKVKAGNVIHVPRDEARRMSELDIAERCDDF